MVQHMTISSLIAMVPIRKAKRKIIILYMLYIIIYNYYIRGENVRTFLNFKVYENYCQISRREKGRRQGLRWSHN